MQVRFTANKTNLISNIGVASRVVERIKTQDFSKLGNIRKISNLGGEIAQRPVSLPEIILWQ